MVEKRIVCMISEQLYDKISKIVDSDYSDFTNQTQFIITALNAYVPLALTDLRERKKQLESD